MFITRSWVITVFFLRRSQMVDKFLVNFIFGSNTCLLVLCTKSDIALNTLALLSWGSGVVFFGFESETPFFFRSIFFINIYGCNATWNAYVSSCTRFDTYTWINSLHVGRRTTAGSSTRWGCFFSSNVFHFFNRVFHFSAVFFFVVFFPFLLIFR